MFSMFYYAQYGSDIIYYTHNSSNEGYEFYVNDRLIDLKKGVIGEFNFSHEDYSLMVKTKFKTTHRLSVLGKEIPLTKIKKKELQKLLSSKGLYNEMNPTARQIEQNRFKPEVLLVPFLLMIIGFAIQYYTQGGSMPSALFPLIPEAIAGWMLYDIAAARSNSLKNLRKGRVGFMAMVIVGLGLLGEFLFQYF